MRLPDDDEIYDVDATYLGPPGRYLGRFRHKTMILWPLLFLLAVAIENRIGVPMQLLPIGLTVLAVSGLTGWIADSTTTERPVKVMAAVLWHELAAARPALRGQRAGRPRLRLRTRVGAGPAPDRTGRRRLRDFAA